MGKPVLGSNVAEKNQRYEFAMKLWLKQRGWERITTAINQA